MDSRNSEADGADQAFKDDSSGHLRGRGRVCVCVCVCIRVFGCVCGCVRVFWVFGVWVCVCVYGCFVCGCFGCVCVCVCLWLKGVCVCVCGLAGVYAFGYCGVVSWLLRVGVVIGCCSVVIGCDGMIGSYGV